MTPKIQLGKRVKDGKPFTIELGEVGDLSTHALISGRTGMGKSRFLALLLRRLTDFGVGWALLESGDLCDDTIAYYGKRVAETKNKNILKKIHYLRASPAQCFRYDLFRMPEFRVHPELRDSFRKAWIHAKVHSRMEVLQSVVRGTESFEGTPRLQRVLTSILTGVAVEVERKRLSVADADILLDITHDDHHAVFEKLRARLPREVVADFEIIHRMVRVQDLRMETESTLNTLRALGPLMKAVLSATGAEPSVDLFQIIQRGEHLLVPLQEDELFSCDQKILLAAQILHDLIETIITTPRQLRKPFVIVIDEAGELMRACGERVNRALGMLRKYMGGGGIILGGQDLSTFKHGDKLDLAPKLLSQVGLLVTFNQRWPEDLEKFARVMFAGNFRFDQIVNDVERYGGIEWIEVTEHSEQWNRQHGTSRGETESSSDTVSNQVSNQTGKTTGTGETISQQESSGQVNTRSKPVEVGKGPEQVSEANSKTAAKGTARTQSESSTETHGTSHGTASTRGTAKTTQESETTGQGLSISHKLVPLANPPVREKQETGMLKDPNQLDKFVQIIACLKKKHAVVLSPNETEAFEIVVDDVPDPFSSIEAQMKCVEWIKRQLYAIHPYFFTPDLSEEERERRIREFLSDAHPPGQQEAIPDVKPDVIAGDDRDDQDVNQKQTDGGNAYGN